MTAPDSPSAAITRVVTGMRVFDSDDEQVGTVSTMKMGAPGAAGIRLRVPHATHLVSEA